MRKFFIILLIFLLTMPAASATEIAFPYEVSDWAYEDAVKAMDMNLMDPRVGPSDLRPPINRSSFASYAASLVALEFGSNMRSYLLIMNYRGQVEDDTDFYLSSLDVAQNLGIIAGRGDGNLDANSYINRQEAAVMLARTYRTYQDTVPDALKPLPFADQGDIADWALEDVRLMNHLGIMTGVEDNRFDPLGSYTIEQCLVTLVRLHEKAPYDGSKQENPFAIPSWEGGFVKVWDKSLYAFAIETEDHYICAWTYTNGSGLGYLYYYIEIVDQDFSFRSYLTPIITNSSWRGSYHAKPEHPAISEDGATLTYTATVKEDAYHYDIEGKRGEAPLFPKGIYTVTMDLKTGEQTYTRADLSEN